MVTRAPRERVTRPDGSVAVQTKRPRADLLAYRRPGGRGPWLVTVLVRFTHRVEVARPIAEKRWLTYHVEQALKLAEQEGRECAGVISPPELVRHRIGWWTTSTAPQLWADAARDEQGRAVRWRENPAAFNAAGPGIEFRP